VNVVVTVMLCAAIMSVTVGFVTAIIAFAPSSNRPEFNPAMTTGDDSSYRTLATWTVLLGVFLMIAPNDYFGPSWAYFAALPHNGFGMGLCLTILAVLQLIDLWRHDKQRLRLLSHLFFLTGFVYWTAGITLGAEGILGHGGLMEAPFMMMVGAHNFVHSARIMGIYRAGQRQ
jgi:hypothetical protein